MCVGPAFVGAARVSLWLLRHAQPLIAAGTCYGQLDVPANAALTLAAAHAVAPQIPHGARLVYSPLQRCVQLADALCALRPDLATHQRPDARLMEMDFGVHEGRAWSAIAPEEVQAWTDDFAHHCFGGNESVHAFMARVQAAWEDYCASSDWPTLWVSHAGVGRALALVSQGLSCVDNAGQWPLDGLGYGQWCRFEPPCPPPQA